MTEPLGLDALKAEHQPFEDDAANCEKCSDPGWYLTPYPCTVVRLCDEVERLRGDVPIPWSANIPAPWRPGAPDD